MKKSKTIFLYKKEKKSEKEGKAKKKGHLPFILSHNDGV